MDVGRRAFLSLLGVGTVGMLAADQLPRFLVYDPAKLTVADGPLVDIASITSASITSAIVREMERTLGGYRTVTSISPRGSRLGKTAGGTTMLHHRNLSMLVPLETELDTRKRYVKPAADIMAADIKQRGIRTLTNLYEPAPKSSGNRVAVVNGARVSLRGSLVYDVALDTDLMRFEFIGG